MTKEKGKPVKTTKEKKPKVRVEEVEEKEDLIIENVLNEIKEEEKNKQMVKTIEGLRVLSEKEIDIDYIEIKTETCGFKIKKSEYTKRIKFKEL